VNKANKHILESLPYRIDRVRSFLTLFKPNLEYDIVPIQDVYGPTAVDPDIQALVISKETLSGGAAGLTIPPTFLLLVLT
jgi:pantetheine-phosphate adenylyltransferase